MQEMTAAGLGYPNVPAMKYDVTKFIRQFCASGKYLFAMCSGAETFDLALSAEELDINPFEYGLVTPDLDFDKTLSIHIFSALAGFESCYQRL